MNNIFLNQELVFLEGIDPLKSDFEQFISQFLAENLEEFQNNPPAFYKILDNSPEIEEIINFAETEKNKWQEIIVCGIGGSALGAKAIYDAINPEKKLTILETIDPFVLEKIIKKDLSKSLFVFISKSGTTLETVAQFSFFKEELKKQGLNWQKQSIFITGNQGKFREIADQENIKTFSVPEEVGGRFSVFTPVGLVPLALADIDIAKLIVGTKTGKENALNKNWQENIPLRLAAIEYLAKKSISVLFIYSERLEAVGRFWRQLLAESIGRSEEIGILPHIAIGTRDQHSDLQLFTEGPSDKLFTFLIEKTKNPLSLPKIDDPDYNYLNQQKFSDLIWASKQGTKGSLTEKGRPNQTLEIEKITEEAIGELLFIFEAEIAYLGKMFKINPFNQPGVEQGKKITKKILKNEN